MKKKIVSTLLAVSMIAAALTGCGNSASAPADSAPAAETPAADAPAAESPADTQAAAEGAVDPVTGEALEPVTLKFILFGDKKSAVDEVWAAIADYTRDTLNCDFDVQFVSGDDYKQKLLVKAATGDVWDLNFDSDWTGYFQMAAQDAYMELDELLPAYAPNLYAVYEEKGLLDAMKNKGHINILPWTMTMNNRPFIQWRGDLAEAAGIEVDKDSINTIEDVDKLLYQLKEAYPDKYIIECSQLSGGGWFTLDDGMGLYFNLNDENPTVYAAEDIPEYVEAMKYAEKWQKDGLIWKDVLTDNLDHNSLINEGKLITKWGTHEFATQNRAWVEDGAYWDYTEIYADDLYANRTPLANALCISATSENPERTLMFLDMLETDQTLYDLVQYGIEGKTYVVNEETGAAEYPDGMDGASSNYQEWGGQWAMWKPQFMRANASYGPGFWEKEAEYAASSDKNVVSPLEGFSFDASNVTTEVAQRNQIFDDAKKLLTVGLAGDTQTAIDKLKADSEAAGKQTLIDEYQRQIDEFMASKAQ